MGSSAVRIERDFLGKIAVPRDAYYGGFTQRALENFQISHFVADPDFLHALAFVKKASAKANMHFGLLDTRRGEAILHACDEILTGKHFDQFPVDIFQAGAGTPFNMNMNEVLANLATEFLGGKKGEYLVSPNDHVNMSQSTNDVIPTAMRLTLLFKLPFLLHELDQLITAYQKKAETFSHILKVGRTHLMDAVPLTLGQEFQAVASLLQHERAYVHISAQALSEIHLGGTAIGTGLNTPPTYHHVVTKELAHLTKLPFVPTPDPIELTSSMHAFVMFSNALRSLSISLLKLCNDLVLLNSGPRAGISEIMLQGVEPGSSIMAGKVNPSIVESLQMVCYQVLGNDHAVVLAAQAGQLELNTMTPVIMDNLFNSLNFLTRALQGFIEKCVVHIQANLDRCRQLLEQSTCYATALNPYFGYKIVSFFVHESILHHKDIRTVLADTKILTAKELDTLLSLEALTEPRKIDLALRSKIQQHPAYQIFLKKVS